MFILSNKTPSSQAQSWFSSFSFALSDGLHRANRVESSPEELRRHQPSMLLRNTEKPQRTPEPRQLLVSQGINLESPNKPSHQAGSKADPNPWPALTCQPSFRDGPTLHGPLQSSSPRFSESGTYPCQQGEDMTGWQRILMLASALLWWKSPYFWYFHILLSLCYLHLFSLIFMTCASRSII